MLFVKKKRNTGFVWQKHASFKPKLLVFVMEEIISPQRGGTSFDK